MRSSRAILVFLGLFAASPLSAQTIDYEFVDLNADPIHDGGERSLPSRWVVQPSVSVPTGAAAYGPFRVLDGQRAALVDVTNGSSPRAHGAMPIPVRSSPSIRGRTTPGSSLTTIPRTRPRIAVTSNTIRPWA